MNTNWNDIVGHENNISRLKHLIAKNKLPHAVLFTGNKGIGKARVAEALATAILCQAQEQGVPCGACESCMALKNGIHPDFYRIIPTSKTEGAAKSIYIEQVRELQEKASRVPVLSEKSVAIIESVELMRVEAANSLLKTIEEPDAPITFILLTSSPAFLLDTIISRCTRMEFGLLSTNSITDFLLKQGISEVEAKKLSSLSDGSIGRSLELRSDEIKLLQERAEKLLEELPKGDEKWLWQQGELLGKHSRDDLTQCLSFVAMFLRDMLLLYSGSTISLYNQNYDKINKLMNMYKRNKINAMLKLVLACQYRLRYNVNIRLTMETFVFRLKDIVEEKCNK